MQTYRYLAPAALLIALAGCDERTVVADPAVANEAADSAAEMNIPTYTPIELGNGAADANAAESVDAGTE